MNDDRIAKLPKWARDEIDRLNMRLREANKIITRFNGDASGARFVAERNDRTLNLDGWNVRLRIGEHDHLLVRPDDHQRNMLYISGLSDTFLVQPWSSNVIKVGQPTDE